MQILIDEGARLAIEVDEALDEMPPGGWSRVSELWHVGEALPAADILAKLPQLKLLSSWYTGDDDRAAHAGETIALARKLKALTALHVDVDAAEPARFAPVLAKAPALEVLGLRIAFLSRTQLAGWLAVEAVARARCLRLAVRQGPEGFAPLLVGLEAAAAALETVEISFDFGWEAWSLRARRDARGRFGDVVLEGRPLTDRAFGKAKLTDVVAFLDALPSDALASLVVEAHGLRVTSADVAAIAACLPRHTALTTCRVRDRILPVAGARAVAAPTADEQRVADAAAAQTALQRRAEAAGVGLDPTANDPLLPLAEAFAVHTRHKKALPPAEMVTLALSVLELPTAKEPLVDAALALLERAPTPGTVARLVSVLDREASVRLRIVRATEVPLRWLLPQELPRLLDWYETRPDNGLPMGTRKLATNEWFQNIVVACGDCDTAEELQRRLDHAPLTAWKREVYTSLRRALSRRKKPKK